MENNLILKENSELQKDALSHFVQKLNENPKQEIVKINKMAKNSQYIPISFVEAFLDDIFMGVWSTKNFTTQVIANEIIGNIELEVFHPIAKTFITRVGAGAVMILQKADSDLTDISSKIKNTLVKDYPHLKSECVKNAARSLGKLFGRDLNREYENEVMNFWDNAEKISTIEASKMLLFIKNNNLHEVAKKGLLELGVRSIREIPYNDIEVFWNLLKGIK